MQVAFPAALQGSCTSKAVGRGLLQMRCAWNALQIICLWPTTDFGALQAMLLNLYTATAHLQGHTARAHCKRPARIFLCTVCLGLRGCLCCAWSKGTHVKEKGGHLLCTLQSTSCCALCCATYYGMPLPTCTGPTSLLCYNAISVVMLGVAMRPCSSTSLTSKGGTYCAAISQRLCEGCAAMPSDHNLHNPNEVLQPLAYQLCTSAVHSAVHSAPLHVARLCTLTGLCTPPRSTSQ